MLGSCSVFGCGNFKNPKLKGVSIIWKDANSGWRLFKTRNTIVELLHYGNHITFILECKPILVLTLSVFLRGNRIEFFELSCVCVGGEREASKI